LPVDQSAARACFGRFGERAGGPSLLREAALEARSLYPELFASDAPLPTNESLQQRGAYFVAVLAGHPVACGGLRPIDAVTVEVRRMYVLPSARRRGVARAVLARLEQAARSLGYGTMRLETGNRQAPAMALYESFGFTRIAPFGQYAKDPTIVCYEKRVGEAEP
jgi:putative acetyltransferase